MDSSQDEKGACAILGAQLDEELGGGPVQVGVICLPCSFSHLVYSFVVSGLAQLRPTSVALHPVPLFILPLMVSSLLLLPPSSSFLRWLVLL